MDGFIFSTEKTVLGRILPCDWLIKDSICDLAVLISVLQSTKTEISQLPREVVLRIYCSPSVRRMMFSKGMVTVVIILSTGCCPASAMTLIFGKVMSGKSPVLRF